jgi:hypothetical protein
MAGAGREGTERPESGTPPEVTPSVPADLRLRRLVEDAMVAREKAWATFRLALVLKKDIEMPRKIYEKRCHELDAAFDTWEMEIRRLAKTQRPLDTYL